MKSTGLILKVAAAKQNRAGRQTFRKRAIVVTAQPEGTATIVIAEKRDGAVRTCDVHDEFEHLRQPAGHPLGKMKSIYIRERQRLKIEVGGIAVVIRREFAVHTLLR